MNWTALGAIGELVGGLVVVATLVYLAAQIRQNTRATKAAATAAIASEMEEVLLAIAQDDTLAGAYAKASQGAELTAVEYTKLRFWWAALGRSAHSHVIQTDLGTLSEDNREPIQKVLRAFCQVPLLAQILRELIDQELYPEDFCNWVDENVLS